METALQNQLTPCPICKASARHLFVKDGYRIARCPSCSTLFVQNPPDDTSFVYDENYFFGGERGGGYGSYDDEKEVMRGTFEKCLDLILKHGAKGSLFDVGAATGYFLSLARERGFRGAGVDISAAAAREAQKKGLAVEAGTLQTVPHPPTLYDAVTLFDVLEHVPQPGKLISSAVSLLRDGGIIMGSTPDSMSINARLFGRYWHMLFPPEHLVLLNDKSLRLILERAGCEVIWTGRITKRFSIPYILQTASRWIRFPALSRLGNAIRGTWMSRVGIPLDLRDNLFFLARKTRAPFSHTGEL